MGVLAQLAIYALWLLWGMSWLIAAAWSNRTAKRAPWQENMAQRLAVILGVVLLFGFYSPRHLALTTLWSPSQSFGWAMVGLVLAGFTFAWWARLHLGLMWSSDVGRKADHQIVATGPYRLVRHPIYSGIILAAFATAAQMGTAAALAGAAIMTLAWYIKARFEERFLARELGQAYEAYAGRVPMLVPFAKF